MEDNFVRKYGDPEGALAASKNVIKVQLLRPALSHPPPLCLKFSAPG